MACAARGAVFPPQLLPCVVLLTIARACMHALLAVRGLTGLLSYKQVAISIAT